MSKQPRLLLRPLNLERLEERAVPAAFTPNNLVVYRVGTGAGGLTNASAAVFLDEYTPTGTLVQSVAMPTAASGANAALTATGNSTSEGFLTRSTDGNYLILTGYNTGPGTANVAGTATTTVPRTIGRVAFGGVIDTTTTTTSFNVGSIRSAVSTDGNDLWAVGSNTGVVYTTLSSTGPATVVSTTATAFRQIQVFNGQLYTSAAIGAIRLGAVGTGTPTTTGQTITALPGIPTTGQLDSFFFADLSSSVPGVDTLYIANEMGTIQKFSLVGTNWVARGTIGAPTVRGLTGSVNGTSVSLYVTNGNGASLQRLTDSSGYDATITGSLTLIGSAGTNRAFRGVALVPNIAPVLAGANNFTAIAEDATSNSGTLVSAFVAGQVTDTASEPSGIALTATVTSNGTWEFSTTGGSSWSSVGTVSDSSALLLKADANTRLRFVPNADFNGTIANAITFRAWDQNTGTAGTKVDASSNGGNTAFSATTANSSIGVTEVNDSPTAVDDPLSAVAEDSGARTISFASLLSNDLTGTANEPGQTLTITGVDSAVGGMVSISGTDVIFTLDPDFNGTASFNYTVTDDGTTNGVSDPMTATATASFTITEVNDAPTAQDDTLTDYADNLGDRTIPFVDLLGNDSQGPANEAAQTLTIITVGSATGGTVSLSGTDVIFSPTPGFNGIASFSYTMQDDGTTNGTSDPKTATGTASFLIFPINDPPVANDDGLSSIAEDSSARTISFASLLANDNPGPNESTQTITLISVGNAVGGTVTLSGTDVIFTPDLDFFGMASFQYTIEDDGTTSGISDPQTASATVSFDVTEVNDAPVPQNDTLTAIAEDSGPRTIPFTALLGNDAAGPANESGQSLTIFAVGISVGGTVSISGTDVIFTPDPDFNGTASFSYAVADNGTTNGVLDSNTANASVSFTVTPVNDPPVPQNDTLTAIAEASAPRTIPFADLLGNDGVGPVDETGQSLTIISVGSAVGGTVSISGMDVIFTLDPDFNGTASFNYTVTDDGTTNGSPDPRTASANVSFDVTEVNDAPVPQNDTLTAIAEDSGPRTIPFTALLGNDAAGPANESGQSLTILSVDSSVGGTVSISGTDVIFTPDPDFNGTVSFSYTIADDGTTNGVLDSITAIASVSFTVTTVNDLPVPQNDSLPAVAEDSAQRTIPFNALLGNDSKGPANESGQSLTITSVGTAVGGTVTINGSNILFIPESNFNGTASFSYTVSDNGTTAGVSDPKTATANASFTITEVNDVPVTQSDTLTAIAEDSGARTIPFSALLGNDSTGPANESGQSLTIVSVNSAIGGTVSISGTNVIFTPALDFNGPASFRYTATDNGTTNLNPAAKTAIGSVGFMVTEVNDVPVVGDDDLTPIDEDSGPTTIAFELLLGNDSPGPANESTQTRTISSVNAAVGGTVSILGTDIVFTPTPNFNGSASFRYTVVDNGTTNGASDPQIATATVSFTVTSVNDLPTAGDDATTIIGTKSILVNVLVNDSTVPDVGEALSVVSVSQGTSGGTVTIEGGQVVYSRPPKFNGFDTFTYTISDGLATTTATVTVTVGNPGVPASLLAVGTDTGTPGMVKVMDATTRDVLFQLAPYAGYQGGIQVVTGDVTGDGTEDVITSSATGVGHVMIFDGITGTPIASLLPFGLFPSGLSLASADLDNDGFDDIVVGVQNGPTHVMAFSGQTGEVLQSFFANQGFLGGVRVAAGDINADGFADIVTVAGPGGNGHIRVYSGQDHSLLQSYLAYVGFQGEVALTVANLSGGGTIVTAAMNLSAGVHVRGTDATGEVFSYFAPQSFSGPASNTVRRPVPSLVARIASGDTNGDRIDDIFIALGPAITGTPTKVLLQDGATFAVIDTLFAFGNLFKNGAFVG